MEIKDRQPLDAERVTSSAHSAGLGTGGMVVSLSYLFYFGSLGVAVAFLSPALLEMGYSKQQVGSIIAATYAFNILVPILGGRLTDKFLSLERTICLGAWLMVAFCGFLWGFSREPSLLFLVALMGYAAARAPMVSLQDALAMQVVKDHPAAYGRIRMVGSLGFAVGSAGFGYLVEAQGSHIFFVGLFVVTFVFGLQSLFLPSGSPQKSGAPEQRFWHGLEKKWWIWLLAMSLHWVAFAPYHYGFTLLLLEQDVPAHLTGWYWSVGVAAEVLAFIFSGWFFSRWSVRRLLLVALAANLVRWLLVGLFPSPLLLLMTQLIHGLGFGLFYSAAMSAIASYSGGSNRASYQGLFSTCVGGVGSIVGSLLSGFLHQRMPLDQVILWFVPIQILALIILIFNPLGRDNRVF